jgi:hypothetical protein
MKQFEIREDGNKFAVIPARSAESALKKAAKQFPRRACDYNGYIGPVTWRAFLASEPYALASIELQVR